MTVAPLRKRPAWASLEQHYKKMQGVHLRELFAGAAQYSYAQDELAAFYLLYRRTMAHWRSVLPPDGDHFFQLSQRDAHAISVHLKT